MLPGIASGTDCKRAAKPFPFRVHTPFNRWQFSSAHWDSHHARLIRSRIRLKLPPVYVCVQLAVCPLVLHHNHTLLARAWSPACKPSAVVTNARML